MITLPDELALKLFNVIFDLILVAKVLPELEEDEPDINSTPLTLILLTVVFEPLPPTVIVAVSVFAILRLVNTPLPTVVGVPPTSAFTPLTGEIAEVELPVESLHSR